MKFLLKVQRPFKNREGNYDEDIVNFKVWTNNIDDLDVIVYGIKQLLWSKDGDSVF
ncbi:hypothetical protein P344_03925 [Spiroplasma mirum ATCC 29335]|uniref:Uncharacterized protein n=1 Tax=Spiroplasma mirum ATCC 29335 TaxID=838561 RepID=W6AN23_9MOLU|nr:MULTISPECIES: hypothetical protein [Spiroplasma]AHI58120.1 hypothetical protein P344_03925 [Spiroplasma mirum ATCC 29335]